VTPLEKLTERLNTTRPTQRHLVFLPGEDNWAAYCYSQIRMYGGPAVKGTTKLQPTTEVWLRRGKRVDGLVVVSIGSEPAEMMDYWLKEFWPQLLNARALFSRRREFALGTKVQSHYQRQWFGHVIGPGWIGCADHTVRVMRTHDACGRPHRKPTTTTLDVAWLRRVES